MNQRDYQRAMKQILPSEGKKDALWKDISDAIDSKEKKKSYQFSKWAYGLTIIGIVLVASFYILPNTAMADNMKDFFKGLLKEDTSINEYVKENVWWSSNSHLKVQIQEMVSDGMAVEMTVKYEALDEEGKEWLAEASKQSFKETHGSIFKISPYNYGNTWEYGVGGWGSDCVELTDYRTEEARYYYVNYRGSEVGMATEKGEVSYWTDDGLQKVILDTPCNMPYYEYRLQPKNGEKLSEYYEPHTIRVSEFSYVVYGVNKGLLHQKCLNGYYISQSLLSSEESEKESITEVYLIKKDGTLIDVGVSYFCGGLSESVINQGTGYDCLVASNSWSSLEPQIYENLEEKEKYELQDIGGIRIVKGEKYVDYEFVNES